MAERASHRLALLSVHPEFAERLADGTKQVEFRKRRLAPDVTHVVVYATQPVGRVVGIFTIDGQVQDTPGRLWSRFKRVAGISQDRFLDYYDGHLEGVGIRVGEFVRFEEGLTLEEAFGISRPPQSFQYFAGEDFARQFEAATA